MRARGSTTRNRQVGAVLGSAAIAVLMDARLAAHGLGSSPAGADGGRRDAGRRPGGVQRGDGPVDAAVPAVLVLGLLAVLFFERPRHFARRR